MIASRVLKEKITLRNQIYDLAVSHSCIHVSSPYSPNLLSFDHKGNPKAVVPLTGDGRRTVESSGGLTYVNQKGCVFVIKDTRMIAKLLLPCPSWHDFKVCDESHRAVSLCEDEVCLFSLDGRMTSKWKLKQSAPDDEVALTLALSKNRIFVCAEHDSHSNLTSYSYDGELLRSWSAKEMIDINDFEFSPFCETLLFCSGKSVWEWTTEGDFQRRLPAGHFFPWSVCSAGDSLYVASECQIEIWK